MRQTVAPADSGQQLLKVIPRLIYEETTEESTFIWPEKMTLPALPAVYQYVIKQAPNQELVQSHYVMIEPDGCSTIINETTKNKYVKIRTVPAEPPKTEESPDSSAVNKDKSQP